MKKPKIIQINCVYNTGSTGKITHDLHSEYRKRGINSLVYYGRGSKTTDPGVYKFCTEAEAHIQHLISNTTGYIYGGCLLSTKKLINALKKEHPDVVHLQCINGYCVNIYKLLNWLKKTGIKTVLTLHAEFMYTGGCGHSFDCKKWQTTHGCRNCPAVKKEGWSYFFDRTSKMWADMKKALSGFNPDNLTIVSVSPWLRDQAMKSPFMKDYQHEVVFNGLDTHIFARNKTTVLSDINKNGEYKTLLYVAPWFSDNPNDIKHGDYILSLSKMLKNEKIKIVIIGKNEYTGIIPPNLSLVGRVESQKKLAEYYSSADLVVLTSKKETFSMIVAESLCCGTPIVGFKAGGPETIALKGYSKWVDFGDINALKDTILQFLQTPFDHDQISREATATYSNTRMADEYIRIYNTIFPS